jgi:predicted nucleotidyltransferase
MLDNNQLNQIRNIVHPLLPDNSYKVFVFGSRATGNNRPFSDVDIGILGNKILPSEKYIKMTESFENSDLPFKVDVVDFMLVTDRFKKQALTHIIDI